MPQTTGVLPDRASSHCATSSNGEFMPDASELEASASSLTASESDGSRTDPHEMFPPSSMALPLPGLNTFTGYKPTTRSITIKMPAVSLRLKRGDRPEAGLDARFGVTGPAGAALAAGGGGVCSVHRLPSHHRSVPALSGYQPAGGVSDMGITLRDVDVPHAIGQCLASYPCKRRPPCACSPRVRGAVALSAVGADDGWGANSAFDLSSPATAVTVARSTPRRPHGLAGFFLYPAPWHRA